MAQRLLIGLFLVFSVLSGGGTIYFHHLADRQAARAAQLENDLTRARTEATRERERADKLTAKATDLDSQLGNAKTRTTATESKNSQLSRELTAAKSSLTERQQREVALLTEIEALRQQINVATGPTDVASLPASSSTFAASASSPVVTTVASSHPIQTGPIPPSTANLGSEPLTTAGPDRADIQSYRERISILEIQLTDLLTRALAESPAVVPEPAPAPVPSAPSPYQVVRVGPSSAFVIVDYGTLHGAAPGDELALCRGTSVLARVQISDARAKFSVAQVLPAALKGQLQPGDFVLIAK